MRFYTTQYQFYCGIDLHPKGMYMCIMNQKGEILYHKNIPTERLTSLSVIDPYREDLVVAVECVFTRSAVYSLLGMHPAWYWLADPFMKENINFVLGRALYTKPMFHFSAEELFLYPLSL